MTEAEKKTMYLWTDLETTGFEPEDGYVLEIAWALAERGAQHQGIRSAVIADPGIDWSKVDPRVIEMHTQNGLILETKGPLARPLVSVVRELVEALDRCGAEVVHLAGSSVHFDRSWIRHHLPEVYLHPKFHHRELDVSTILLMRSDLGLEKLPELKDKPHRAVPDLLQTLATYARFLGEFGGTVEDKAMESLWQRGIAREILRERDPLFVVSLERFRSRVFEDMFEIHAAIADLPTMDAMAYYVEQDHRLFAKLGEYMEAEPKDRAPFFRPYVLDDQGVPVVEPDPKRWIDWMATRNLSTLRTRVEEFEVETMFVGADVLGDGKLWRTKIHDRSEKVEDSTDHGTWFWSSWNEAHGQHEAIVGRVKASATRIGQAHPSTEVPS